MKSLYVLILFVLSCALVFSSCSGLDDLNSRVDALEGAVRDLKTAVNQLDAAYRDGKVVCSVQPNKDENDKVISWTITFSDNTSLLLVNGRDGESFFNDVTFHDGYVFFTMKDGTVFQFAFWEEQKPRIIQMEFLMEDNPLQLISNILCEIVGDSVITCRVPYLMKNKFLIPRISVEGGGTFTIGEQSIVSGETRYDFSRPVELKVSKGELESQYKVFVHSFTGLPVIWIDTDGRQDITSKEEYLHAKFRLEENVVTRAPGDIIEKEVSIRGRGNNTWLVQPKKPYRLKFEEKVSLLDEPEDKSWVLLANYYDKTMLRNSLTFFLGRNSNLEYTPNSHFVELMLNGRYNGTYELVDKLKISKNRARPGGILLEVDRYATVEDDARYFMTDSLRFPINIKDPDVEYDDETYTFAKNYIQEAERILFSNDFKDPEKGWQQYMDIDTFADWYIISEMAKNAETIWMTSYMTLKKGEKIMMGPLWDYDKSYGNFYRSDFPELESPQGYWVKNSPWFSRLFQDEAFIAKLKERIPHFRSRLNDVLKFINDNATYLRWSAEENNNRWDIFYHPDPYNSYDYDIWGNYQNEVQCLKEWFLARFEWLSSEIDNL